MIWDQFFEWLMTWESRSVTNHPSDPGGQTAWGISRRYHPNWGGWDLVDAGQTHTPDFEHWVSAFYRTQYWTLWERFSSRLAPVVVDTAINMGEVYAIQCLQDSLNRLAGSKYVYVDGRWGSQTSAAVRSSDQSSVALSMCALRLAEYGRRGKNGDPRRVFLDGWINRVRSLMEVI
mgnify:CR=1 FL=1